jgi:hypothetical protein
MILLAGLKVNFPQNYFSQQDFDKGTQINIILTLLTLFRLFNNKTHFDDKITQLFFKIYHRRSYSKHERDNFIFRYGAKITNKPHKNCFHSHSWHRHG